MDKFLQGSFLFIVLIAGFAFFQSERNDCYWHGMDNWPAWIYCVGKIRW